jgi:hypothetical protein
MKQLSVAKMRIKRLKKRYKRIQSITRCPLHYKSLTINGRINARFNVLIDYNPSVLEISRRLRDVIILNNLEVIPEFYTGI